jgi:D-cysteine desulfhydrase
MLGDKVRKLEFVAAYALQEQCDVLITCGGIQSNHFQGNRCGCLSSSD